MKTLNENLPYILQPFLIKTKKIGFFSLIKHLCLEIYEGLLFSSKEKKSLKGFCSEFNKSNNNAVESRQQKRPFR